MDIDLLLNALPPFWYYVVSVLLTVGALAVIVAAMMWERDIED